MAMNAQIQLILLFIVAMILSKRLTIAIDCEPGQVGLPTEISCKICGAGKYAGSTAQRTCTDCPPGTFLYDQGTTASKHDSLSDCADWCVNFLFIASPPPIFMSQKNKHFTPFCFHELIINLAGNIYLTLQTITI